MRRVAVTGLGAITPVGNTAPETWRAAVAGESGVDWIRAFDADGLPVRVAAEVKDFDATGLASPKELRRFDRNVVLALGAAKEAVADSGLNGFDPMRVGIVFGSAIGGLIGIVEQADTLRERGADRISPYFIPSVLVDSASGQLAISLGIRGPELRAGLGLRDRLARRRRGSRDHPPRRRRRHPRRRHGGLHPSADPRRLHAR